jgi:crossover junction endodeoxyribonuclease RuvC
MTSEARPRRGAVLLAACRAGLPVVEYAPPQVKQAVTSYRQTDKRQAQGRVKALLNLRAIPPPDDAADGLAIAHIFTSRPTLQRVK